MEKFNKRLLKKGTVAPIYAKYLQQCICTFYFTPKEIHGHSYLEGDYTVHQDLMTSPLFKKKKKRTDGFHYL